MRSKRFLSTTAGSVISNTGIYSVCNPTTPEVVAAAAGSRTRTRRRRVLSALDGVARTTGGCSELLRRKLIASAQFCRKFSLTNT